MVFFIDVNWILDVARKTISEVERGYPQYRDIIDDAGHPTHISADVVHHLDDTFAH